MKGAGKDKHPAYKKIKKTNHTPCQLYAQYWAHKRLKKARHGSHLYGNYSVKGEEPLIRKTNAEIIQMMLSSLKAIGYSIMNRP